MKEVILHIGTHKTGTTSIQSALKGYNDGKSRVTSLPYENHSISIYTAFSAKRHSYHIWKRRGLSAKEIDRRRRKYLKILEADLRDKTCERLIISGEDISILSSQEKSDLMKYISRHGVAVKLIVYVRSPLSYVVSAIQQQIRTGSYHLKPICVDYRKKISPFFEHIPREHITVCDYDMVVSSQVDIVEHFSKVAGLSLPVTSRKNTSLQPRQLALIYKLNAVPARKSSRSRRPRIRKRIYEAILTHYVRDDDSCVLEKQQFEYLCDPSAQGDCEWLKQQFGIHFDFENSAKSKSLDRYFDTLLRDELDRIQQTFCQLGHYYDCSLSIEDNFSNLYTSLETASLRYWIRQKFSQIGRKPSWLGL